MPLALSASCTRVRNSRVSMGMRVFRAYICSAPVVKPWGKKKPEIQKEAGGPVRSHLSRVPRRSIKSLTQVPRGLREG